MSDALITALRDPARYPHPVPGVELVETHISWVLLAGDYAYKIKKPLELGFLDFSTLEARRRCCEEELRLNRRTAPRLYLEVVPISGSAVAPLLGGRDAPIEYAVKMRRFAADALLDGIARRGGLQADIIDRLARAIAALHAAAGVAPAGSEHGAADGIARQTRDNFAHIARLEGASAERPRLERLRRWSDGELERLAPLFDARQAAGRVRECHGDLHLGNVALIDGEPVPFDCIEFNPALRWIDVVSEISFLAMDLIDHRLPRLAFRALDGWLEASGDHDGIAVLRHYLVYRAMVRAKVACIRAHQDGAAHGPAAGDYRDHLGLAERLAAPGRPLLVLMHGLSASGKSTIALELLERVGALRLRSDVERKRLHGIAAAEASGSAPGGGIYDAGSTMRTYARLAAAARAMLAAGWPVIVDATFLERARRDAFGALARELGVPCAIVSCAAPESVLRERIAARARQSGDASEATAAVLARQVAAAEPLGGDELQRTLTIDASRRTEHDSVVAQLAALRDAQCA